MEATLHSNSRKQTGSERMDREMPEKTERMEDFPGAQQVQHHLGHCAQCQNFIMELITFDPSRTAGMIWCHLRSHSLDMEAKGLR
jgi:hypothetical protein